ncbi:type IV pilus twitching motility protein PilT [Tatumella ptyseos]|uniref:type IV pilus twitching motility protein PilT n=1 Tax=Tatumella ptyseos TaxID=82987 RepID=UPI0026EFCDD1|nr:PilT/PilU family type 4a pilus ATPase [Tatumella ptyseos]WKX27124.1 PilT/PilU family type 4a pilus ATPase [Tatumella ptyseos]
MELTELIARSVKHNASDLHLCCGEFPRWRRENTIEIIPGSQKLPHAWFKHFLSQQITGRLSQLLAEQGHCDFALTSEQGARVRASFFKQHQGFSLSLRILPAEAKDIESLQLPSAFIRLVEGQQGLILISGATGSGKSTTLTAVIDHLNQHYQRHIIMLEDPIEFCHSPGQSLIQQREIGEHVSNLSNGIVSALRQDPDIIVIGELRDTTTIKLALTAAETGHLVLATLHSTDTTHALQRLVDAFPPHERDTARQHLAQSLRAVLAQQLRFKAERVSPLYELLINTNAVGNLIREAKFHQLPGQLEQASQEGMVSFRQSLEQYAKQNSGLLCPTIDKALRTNFPK